MHYSSAWLVAAMKWRNLGLGNPSWGMLGLKKRPCGDEKFICCYCSHVEVPRWKGWFLWNQVLGPSYLWERAPGALGFNTTCSLAFRLTKNRLDKTRGKSIKMCQASSEQIWSGTAVWIKSFDNRDVTVMVSWSCIQHRISSNRPPMRLVAVWPVPSFPIYFVR